MTVVKICGLTVAEDAEAAVRAGADMLGFHLCPSRRRIEPEAVERIVGGLSRRPTLVGVFIDEEPARVDELADRLGLDLVQLHGSEQPGYPSARPMIKVLKVRDGVVPTGEGWPDPVMLDSWSADQRGGTGLRWDWSRAGALLESRQVMIAGGLDASSVGTLIRTHRPWGVDVSSGVESAPGRKDPELMRRFVAAVREADDD